MDIWDEFDNAFDTEQLAKDVENNTGSSRSEVPVGEYEVSIDNMELKSSQKGKPMMSIWFKILNGEHKGQYIFMNQVLEQGFQIHIANEFLKSLGTEMVVEFKNFNQYGNLIMDIKELIDDYKYEYALRYGKNNKGYNTFEISDLFDV